MMELKYKVIKSKKQYQEYSRLLEGLVSGKSKAKTQADEVELLTVLIEKWDNDQNAKLHSFDDPVALLKSLMDERELRAKDVVEILGLSKGFVSEILHHKKRLTNENLQILGKHFGVNIELRYSYKG